MSAITVAIRSYPTGSIPDVVPYYKFDPNPIPILESEHSVGHWLFNATGSTVYNISRNTINKNHLQKQSGTTSIDLARDERRVGTRLDTNTTYTVLAANQQGLAVNGSFFWEVWVKGIDTSFASNQFSITKAGSTKPWSVTFDGTTKLLSFNAGGTVVTGSISAHVDDVLPEYWKRWAGSFINGNYMYLFEDDEVIGERTTAVTFPSGSDSGTFTIANGQGILIDELFVGTGAFSPIDNTERFELTRPHIFRVGVPSGSVQRYHQMELTMFGISPGSVQFHQFSMRGIKDLHLLGNPEIRDEDLRRYPLFPATGGL